MKEFLALSLVALGGCTSQPSPERDLGDEVPLKIASACLDGEDYPKAEMDLLKEALKPQGRQMVIYAFEAQNKKFVDEEWMDEALRTELACAWLNVSRTLKISPPELAAKINAVQPGIKLWMKDARDQGLEGGAQNGGTHIQVYTTVERKPYYTFHELTHSLSNEGGKDAADNSTIAEGVAEWITSIGFPESENIGSYGGYTFLDTLLGEDIPARSLTEEGFYYGLQIVGESLWETGEVQKRVEAFAEKYELNEGETFQIFTLYNTDYTDHMEFPDGSDESTKMGILQETMRGHGWDWRVEADQTAPNNNLQMKWARYAEGQEGL